MLLLLLVMRVVCLLLHSVRLWCALTGRALLSQWLLYWDVVMMVMSLLIVHRGHTSVIVAETCKGRSVCPLKSTTKS